MKKSRNRNWRIAQKQRNKSRDTNSRLLTFRGEKNWKMLYTRSDKLLRAAKLGIEYPRITTQQLGMRGLQEYLIANERTFYMQS